MTSALVAGPYCSQAEDPPSPPHYSVEGLVTWVSSEIHSFFGTNHVRAPIVVSTQASNSKCPEHTHVNEPQSHPGEFTTFATAIIPSSGCAVLTRVILRLVPLPLHLGTGQYPSPLDLSSPPSLDQGNERSSFSSSQPSASHLSADCSMAEGDITEDPYCSEYESTLGGFPVAPQNLIPRPEVRYDYQPSRPVDPTQESIPGGSATAASTSPEVAVYPPPFNPTLGSYLFPGYPPSSSLENRSVVVPTAHTRYKNEGNKRSTSRKLGKTSQGVPNPLSAAGPIRGEGVDHRHHCTECNASYVRFSGLNRHYKDKHCAWMACDRCNYEFSLGRMYKFTEHLQTCPGA